MDLEDGEFYFHEIIGCTVNTDEGVEVGERSMRFLRLEPMMFGLLRKAEKKFLFLISTKLLKKCILISDEKEIVITVDGRLIGLMKIDVLFAFSRNVRRCFW